jgi:hypothetical protein
MKLEQLLYKLRNWKAHWRAFYLGSYIVVEGAVARMLGDTDVVRAYGELNAVVHRANGSTLDLGCVGKRVVTTAGVNYMRDDFNAATGAADISLFKFHASGTGSVAENITDTALGTEVTDNARTTGSQSGAVSGQYVTIGTIAYTGAHSITEHGIFSAVTTGTLWDRTVFASIGVASGDSIQFTYTLTITAGG